MDQELEFLYLCKDVLLIAKIALIQKLMISTVEKSLQMKQ